MFMKIKITTEKIIKLIMVENDQKKLLKNIILKYVGHSLIRFR